MPIADGDTVVILKDAYNIKAGTLGKVRSLLFKESIIAPNLYNVSFGKFGCTHIYENMIRKVLVRKFPACNLKAGDEIILSELSSYYKRIYTVESVNDECFSVYYKMRDGGRSLLLYGKPSTNVILLDKNTKEEEEKLTVVNKVFYTLIDDECKSRGVIAFVTMMNVKTKTVVNRHSFSVVNLAAGDVFDFEVGCKIAIDRAINGEKFHHEMISGNPYIDEVIKNQYALFNGKVAV